MQKVLPRKKLPQKGPPKKKGFSRKIKAKRLLRDAEGVEIMVILLGAGAVGAEAAFLQPLKQAVGRTEKQRAFPHHTAP